MDRAEFLRVVEESWRAFDDAVAEVAPADRLAPGVVGDWSVVEVIGHVSAWEQQALHHIEQWARGEPLDTVAGPGVDRYNAAEAERRRGWSFERILDEQVETRGRLRTAVEGLGDEAWAEERTYGDWRGTLGRVVAGDLSGDGPGDHAAEHARHIRAWLAGRGTA